MEEFTKNTPIKECLSMNKENIPKKLPNLLPEEDPKVKPPKEQLQLQEPSQPNLANIEEKLIKILIILI